jgi:alanyl aminopeptidase
VDAGKADVAILLELVSGLARDPNLHIARSVADIAAGLDEVVGEAARPAYARFVRKAFGARARRLGWTPKAGEDDDTRLLRNTLLALVAQEGQDAALAAPARALALAWLDDRGAVDRQMLDVVLTTAARHGDAELWQRLRDEAAATEDRRDRQRMLGALAGFRDPELVEASLAITLTEEFDVREASRLLYGPLDDPRTRALAYEFVKTHYDRLVALLPEDGRARLVQIGAAQCDPSVRQEVSEFFAPRMKTLLGGPRAYAQAMERMDLCIEQQSAQRAGVEKFLAKSR